LSIFSPLAVFNRALLELSHLLQPPQSLRKERTGYTGKTVLRLVEVGHVGRPEVERLK